MSEAIEKRSAVDVVDALALKLGHIYAVLDIMTTCQGDECDVNGAAYAMQYMIDDAKTLATELYHAGGAS